LCQIASDESDFEADDKPKDERVVTLKMVKDLEEKLHNSRYYGFLNNYILLCVYAVKLGGYSV
jgi:hypothetical protein